MNFVLSDPSEIDLKKLQSQINVRVHAANLSIEKNGDVKLCPVCSIPLTGWRGLMAHSSTKHREFLKYFKDNWMPIWEILIPYNPSDYSYSAKEFLEREKSLPRVLDTLIRVIHPMEDTEIRIPTNIEECFERPEEEESESIEEPEPKKIIGEDQYYSLICSRKHKISLEIDKKTEELDQLKIKLKCLKEEHDVLNTYINIDHFKQKFA
jgi:hypothetical protein